MSGAWFRSRTGPSDSPPQGATDGPTPAYPLPCLSGRSSETVLFCLVDDTYTLLNPRAQHYESIKRLSDSEVIALALSSSGCEGWRASAPSCATPKGSSRICSRAWWGSLHRRVRKLRRYLEALRREILPDLVGDPETLLIDSTLLEVLHPRQVSQSAGWGNPSAGAAWVRWGSFSVYGVKLHLCS
jgi:hypothetical protein